MGTSVIDISGRLPRRAQVIDLASKRLRASSREATAYECGSVICGCGYRGSLAQRAGEVRTEVPCPVCHRMAPFDAFVGLDGLAAG